MIEYSANHAEFRLQTLEQDRLGYLVECMDTMSQLKQSMYVDVAQICKESDLKRSKACM